MISSYFTSAAKFQILKTLVTADFGLRIRQIEKASELAIRSVQVGLESLLRDRVVIQSRTKGYLYYSLNSKHSHFEFIQKLFQLVSEEELKNQSQKLSEKAKKSLEFSNETLEFIRTRKK